MLFTAIFIFTSFLLTLFGIHYYCKIAIKYKILAYTNFRTLHDNVMPRGGGIVFSLIFILAVLTLSLTNNIDCNTIYAICVGGIGAMALGFIDDVINLTKRYKFILQWCLAIWIMLCFNGEYLVAPEWMPVWFSIFFTLFSLVWLINLYNFMDGIDGMAISGSVSICVTLIIVLLISSGPKEIILIFSLLATCSFAFLIYNWPPAKIFMGDSGSIFLGYIFGVLIIKTTLAGDINIWTWLIVFGYFVGDTTTTTIMRIFLVRNWYGEHQSHAYQNLARIWGSHSKMTRYMLIFHFLWLLPLAIWSTINSELAPLATFFAIFPAIIWTFKFGPRLSSK